MIPVDEVYPTKWERRGEKFRLACYLCALGPGYFVTYEEICDLFWGRREDGGPTGAVDTMRTVIFQLRKRLSHEWKITTVNTRGIILERVHEVHRSLPRPTDSRLANEIRL